MPNSASADHSSARLTHMPARRHVGVLLALVPAAMAARPEWLQDVIDSEAIAVSRRKLANGRVLEQLHCACGEGLAENISFPQSAVQETLP